MSGKRVVASGGLVITENPVFGVGGSFAVLRFQLAAGDSDCPGVSGKSIHRQQGIADRAACTAGDPVIR